MGINVKAVSKREPLVLDSQGEITHVNHLVLEQTNAPHAGNTVDSPHKMPLFVFSL